MFDRKTTRATLRLYRNQRCLRRKRLRPGPGNGAGLFAACEVQHRRQVPAQHDAELAVVRHQRHAVDQDADGFSRFVPRGLFLQRLVKRGEALPVQVRHVGVEKGGRLLGFGEDRRQLRLARFERAELVLELHTRHAVEDRLDGAVEISLDALELLALSDQRRPALDQLTVDLLREILAERLEQPRLYEVRAQTAQDRRLERLDADVEPVVAGALGPCRGTTEQVLRDQRVAAAASVPGVVAPSSGGEPDGRRLGTAQLKPKNV
jgi:hypothetical protein